MQHDDRSDQPREYPGPRTASAYRPRAVKRLLLLRARSMIAVACAGLALLPQLSCRRRTVVDLEVQIRAQPYPRPRCGKGPREAGPVSGSGSPIAGAHVRIQPGDRHTATDVTGKARFPGTTEIARLTVSAPGFRQKTLTAVELPARDGGLRVQLDPCFFPGGNQTEVGFDRRVTLRGRNICGPEWSDAKLKWTQLEGPDVSPSVERWTSRTLSFTTAPLDQVRHLPRKPQMLAFSPDQAGQYVFRLIATSSKGLRSIGHVMVTSASVSSGITSVAPNHTYYFAGLPQGPWNWQITDAPRRWSIRLRGEQTRTPNLRVATRGAALESNESLELEEQNSGLKFSLMIAPWDATPRDCGRSSCHASLEGQWRASRHGASWKMLLDGVHPLHRGEAGESCAACHSLGYDPSSDDGGYDEIAKAHQADFPIHPRSGEYAALPEPVKAVSNVYCLACHGPARLDPPFGSQPGLFSAAVCARCHDRLPEQDNVAQWKTSRHARALSELEPPPTELPGCGKCHVAQSFYRKHFALSRPVVGLALSSCCEHPEPISCQACHNAMLAIYPRQLNAYGAGQTPGGLALNNLAAAAVCIYCHSSEHDTSLPSTIDRRLAPHAPQTELLYGKGAYPEIPGGGSRPGGLACVGKTPQSCVTCHMHQSEASGRTELRYGGHTFRMANKDGRENLAPCRKCHEGLDRFNTLARADYDGDGRFEGVQDETDGLLYMLEVRLRRAVRRLKVTRCGREDAPGAWVAASPQGQVVIVDGKGFDLGDCDANGFVRARRALLCRARISHRAL
jgi:hypothetical protein